MRATSGGFESHLRHNMKVVHKGEKFQQSEGARDPNPFYTTTPTSPLSLRVRQREQPVDFAVRSRGELRGPSIQDLPNVLQILHHPLPLLVDLSLMLSHLLELFLQFLVILLKS